MAKYKFECNGLAAGGQTWQTSGEIESAREGDFPIVLQGAMLQSFDKLTHGKAIFGMPGIVCRGPYTINKMTVERTDG